MDGRRGVQDSLDALEDEFALIKAHGDANMTQEQVAAAMGTTEAFVPAWKAAGAALDAHPGALCQSHAYAPAHTL